MRMVAALIYCWAAGIILLAASRLFQEVLYAIVDYGSFSREVFLAVLDPLSNLQILYQLFLSKVKLSL
jgi:hypothetical protein